MRETMPSPPLVALPFATVPGSPVNSTDALPLSWKPPVAPAFVDVAKFAVMSPW